MTTFQSGLTHEFNTGEDGIERCTNCKVTKTARGRVTPTTALCPVLSPGAKVEYVKPLEALIHDILTMHQQEQEQLPAWSPLYDIPRY